jgi:hypothetical protein
MRFLLVILILDRNMFLDRMQLHMLLNFDIRSKEPEMRFLLVFYLLDRKLWSCISILKWA